MGVSYSSVVYSMTWAETFSNDPKSGYFDTITKRTIDRNRNIFYYLGEIGHSTKSKFTQQYLLELSETFVGREVETINVHLIGCRIHVGGGGGFVRLLVVADGVRRTSGHST